MGQRSLPGMAGAALVGLAFAGVLGVLVATSLPLAIAAMVGAVVVVICLVRPDVGLGLLLLTGAVPLNFITAGQRSVLSGLGGTTVSGALLTIEVAALGLLLLSRGRLVRGIRLFAIPASWVLWSTLTLVYTDWLDEGVRLAFKLWYPLLMGILAYFCCRQPGGVRNMKRWWYAGYTVASAIAVVRLFTTGLSVYASGDVYRYSSVSHPSPFSFFMLATFLLAYSLWTKRRQRADAIVAITAALQVVLSMTRISIGALVLVALLVGALLERGIRRRIQASLAALALGAAILVALVAFPVLQGGVFIEPVSSVGQIVSNPGNVNTQGRDAIWAAVLERYSAGDQALGRGLGSSTRFLKEGDDLGGVGVAHSEYVRVLYEEGLIGLIWLGGVLIASILYLGKRARGAEGLARALLWGACIAVIAYAVICSTDSALDYYNVFGQYVAVLSGAGLAVGSTGKPTGEAVTP